MSYMCFSRAVADGCWLMYSSEQAIRTNMLKDVCEIEKIYSQIRLVYRGLYSRILITHSCEGETECSVG